jgi:hypothetical protein
LKKAKHRLKIGYCYFGAINIKTLAIGSGETIK